MIRSRIYVIAVIYTVFSGLMSSISALMIINFPLLFGSVKLAMDYNSTLGSVPGYVCWAYDAQNLVVIVAILAALLGMGLLIAVLSRRKREPAFSYIVFYLLVGLGMLFQAVRHVSASNDVMSSLSSQNDWSGQMKIMIVANTLMTLLVVLHACCEAARNLLSRSWRWVRTYLL